MDNQNAINREMKKQQLRRQIVPNPADMPPAEKKEEEQTSHSVLSWIFLHKIFLCTVFFLLAAGAGGVFYWNQYHEYTEYKISWEAELLPGKTEEDEIKTETGFVNFIDFGGNVLKYTKDGATCIDPRGKIIWTQPYEMKSPIVSVNKDFAAIADQQGNQIFICDKNGSQGEATTLLPISKIAVSAIGVTAAILEDSSASYLYWFRRNGEPLDISVKSRLAGDGYLMDVSLSPSGEQAVCSYMYINNGRLDSKIVFYDFSEIGKNISGKRIVGGFNEPFSGTIVPRVRFLDNVYSFACSDKGLSFFSSRNLASPELLRQADIEGEICSLFYSEKYIGVIAENSKENPYRMEVYKPDGSLVLKKEFDFSYQYVSISKDQIFLWNETSFQLYNLSGVCKFSGKFDKGISRITAGRFPNSYIITSPQKMWEIILQK